MPTTSQMSGAPTVTVDEHAPLREVTAPEQRIDMIALANAIYLRDPSALPRTYRQNETVYIDTNAPPRLAPRSPWPPCLLASLVVPRQGVAPAAGLRPDPMGRARVIETVANVHRAAGQVSAPSSSGVSLGVVVVTMILAAAGGTLLAKMHKRS